MSLLLYHIYFKLKDTILFHFVTIILLSSFTVSAGVGRTGTFITISTQVKRIKHVRTVDIFNFVQSMRYRRCFMVQTEVGTNTL